MKQNQHVSFENRFCASSRTLVEKLGFSPCRNIASMTLQTALALSSLQSKNHNEVNEQLRSYNQLLTECVCSRQAKCNWCVCVCVCVCL